MSESKFTDHYLPLEHRLYTRALQLTRNPADAADLVQDTNLKALVAWEQRKPEHPVENWAMRILLNTFINGYRRGKIYERVRALYAHERPTADYPAPWGGELSTTVSAELDALPEPFRQAVLLVDLGGYSYLEVAGALGVPVGTIMSRLHRGRAYLRSKLTDLASEYRIGVRE